MQIIRAYSATPSERELSEKEWESRQNSPYNLTEPRTYSSSCRPLLESSVYCTSTSVLTGQGLPLAPGSQHIEDSFQHFPCRYWFPPLFQSILVFLCWIPLFFRYFSLDRFPKFIWNRPCLIAFLFVHFYHPETLYHFLLYFGIGSKFI